MSDNLQQDVLTHINLQLTRSENPCDLASESIFKTRSVGSSGGDGLYVPPRYAETSFSVPAGDCWN